MSLTYARTLDYYRLRRLECVCTYGVSLFKPSAVCQLSQGLARISYRRGISTTMAKIACNLFTVDVLVTTIDSAPKRNVKWYVKEKFTDNTSNQ